MTPSHLWLGVGSSVPRVRYLPFTSTVRERDDCAEIEPSSESCGKLSAENSEMTTFVREDEHDCVWGRGGWCKKHNLYGRRVCRTFQEWKQKKNGIWGWVRRQKTSYICMDGGGHDTVKGSGNLRSMATLNVTKTALSDGSGNTDNRGGATVHLASGQPISGLVGAGIMFESKNSEPGLEDETDGND